MNKTQSNQKVEDAVITDKAELTAIQDELVEKTDGKFIKPPKPKGAKYTRREITRNMAIF